MKSICARLADQRSGFRVGQPVVVEVTADAAAQIFGLADVDDGAVGVLVEVHAGQQRQLGGPVAKVGQRVYNLIVSRVLMLISGGVVSLAPAGRTAAAPVSRRKNCETTPPKAGRAGAARRGRVAQTRGIFAESAGSGEEHHGGRLLFQDQEKLSRRRAPLSAGNQMGSRFAEAFLKLGESEEKLNDHAAAREAYEKYLELAPTAKNAPAIRKRSRSGP